MKNLLILVGILLTITSCDKANDSVIPPKNNSRVVREEFHNLTIEVIKIDGCDYILCDGIESVSIIHKQNCKNH